MARVCVRKVHDMTDERPIAENISELISQLEAREAQLKKAIAQYENELRKLRETVATLRNLRNPERITTRKPTRAMIREYLDTIKAGEFINIDHLYKWAVDSGTWTAKARDQRNAIASALVRMGDDGEIEKRSHGVYFKHEL